MAFERASWRPHRAVIIAALVLLVAPVSAASDWAHEPSPGPGDRTNILYGVAGAAPDDVWAVGRADHTTGIEYRALAIQWDGTAWTEIPVPNPGSYWNDLISMSVIADDDVWAIGTATDDVRSQILAVHWDGSEWAQIATPLFEGGVAAWAMTAPATDDLWIVGEGPTISPLALRGNGSSWELIPTPAPGDRRNALYAAAGAAPDDVWAVGRWRNVGETNRILVMHWDGAAWSIDIASYRSPGIHDTLRGITAIAADDVWAVGEVYVSGEGSQPLIMHYDGAGWTVTELPIFPEGAAVLHGVAAHAPDDVWVDGTHATDEGVPRPLIMHYDGANWTVAEAAETNGSHEWFRAIAAVPGGDTWAVGQYYDGQLTTTLAEVRVAEPSPVGDIDGDGVVDFNDLLLLLAAWGPCDGECPADIDADGDIDFDDLLLLLGNWSE